MNGFFYIKVSEQSNSDLLSKQRKYCASGELEIEVENYSNVVWNIFPVNLVKALSD